MKPERKSAAEIDRHVEEWNSHYPVETQVIVRRDDGSEIVLKIRSQAWVMGGHTAVVKLDGIAGGYMLDRDAKFFQKEMWK